MSSIENYELEKGQENSTRTDSNEDEDLSKKYQDQFIMCLENFSLKKQKNSKKQNEEIEYLYSQINNYPTKEQIVLKTLLQFKEYKLTEKQELVYYKINDESDNSEFKIFDTINRIVHKMLHKSRLINGKESKMCDYFDDLSKTNENITYKNLDKILNIKNNNLKFIPIKIILISMINISGEMINHYIKKSQDNNTNNKKVIYLSPEKEINTPIQMIEPYLFETIYNDYIFTCNMCGFLENNFMECINEFNEKYQLSVKLRDLFNDIFWDCVFHNKVLLHKFINLYLGNEECSNELKKILKKIVINIFDTTTPLKHQLSEIFLPNEFENNEQLDLMTCIEDLKNKYHGLIIRDEINDLINNSVNFSLFCYKPDNNNSNELNEEKKIADNIIKENNNNEINGEIDFEHKSVDDIMNYINNDNKGKKNNKKSNKKKKKKAKKNDENNNNNKNNINNNSNAVNNNNNNKNTNGEIKKEDNDDDEEDQIVLQFKRNLGENLIFANSIHKIKPNISEKWIKIISERY